MSRLVDRAADAEKHVRYVVEGALLTFVTLGRCTLLAMLGARFWSSGKLTGNQTVGNALDSMGAEDRTLTAVVAASRSYRRLRVAPLPRYSASSISISASIFSGNVRVT